MKLFKLIRRKSIGKEWGRLWKKNLKKFLPTLFDMLAETKSSLDCCTENLQKETEKNSAETVLHFFFLYLSGRGGVKVSKDGLVRRNCYDLRKKSRYKTNLTSRPQTITS